MDRMVENARDEINDGLVRNHFISTLILKIRQIVIGIYIFLNQNVYQ